MGEADFFIVNQLEETKVGAILGTDSFVVGIKEQFRDIKSLKKILPGTESIKPICTGGRGCRGSGERIWDKTESYDPIGG